jgi:hypothetical protein
VRTWFKSALALGRRTLFLWGRLLVAVGDAPSAEVVRGELDPDSVLGKDSDVVAAHLSRDVPQHGVPIVELYVEHGIWERLNNGAFQHDGIFFSDNGLTLFAGLCLARRHERTTDQRPTLGGSAPSRLRPRADASETADEP